VLAFGTKTPFVNMPEVPTFESKGYPLYASIDRGAGVPHGTPADRIKVLEAAFLKIASNPEVVTQMRKDGFVPLTMGADAAKAYIADKVKAWAPVVEEFKQ
jgi:tripartite-type tricarboxylate transporter receptor subunit TctC